MPDYCISKILERVDEQTFGAHPPMDAEVIHPLDRYNYASLYRGANVLQPMNSIIPMSAETLRWIQENTMQRRRYTDFLPAMPTRSHLDDEEINVSNEFTALYPDLIVLPRDNASSVREHYILISMTLNRMNCDHEHTMFTYTPEEKEPLLQEYQQFPLLVKKNKPRRKDQIRKGFVHGGYRKRF